MSIADLARDIKNNSSNFINEQSFLQEKFSCRKGMALFLTGIRRLTGYINISSTKRPTTGEKTFKEEYYELLEKFEIEFDEKYLFDWMDGE